MLTGHQDSVNSVAISPDGRLAVSGGGCPQIIPLRGIEQYIPCVDQDNSVRLWDIATSQEIRRFEGHTDAVTAVAFSPDQTTIMSASLDHTLILWDIETGNQLWQAETPTEVFAAIFSLDGQTVLAGSGEQQIVTILDSQSGAMVGRLTPPPRGPASGVIWCMAISHDGRYLMVGEGKRGFPPQGYLVEWDLITAEIARTVRTTSTVRSLAYSLDDRTLLAATYEPLEGTLGLHIATSIVSLLDLETGQELHRFRAGYDVLSGVAFSPDGRQFVSASYDQLLILWDVKTGEVLRRLTGHAGRVYSVAFSPDGQHLLSGSEDGTLRYWDIHHGAEMFFTQAHIGRVSDLAFSPDGRLAVSSSVARELFLWDVATGQLIRRFVGHNSGIESVHFSADGQTIISGAGDNTIRQWDINTGQEIRRLLTATGSGGIWGLSISADGRYLLTAEAETTLSPSNLVLYLREWETGEVIRRFVGHTSLIGATKLSPDGRLAVSTSEDQSIRVWDIASGNELCRLTLSSSYAFNFDISPDSRTALLGNSNGRVLLMDIQNCALVKSLEGHSQLVYDVAFSPDGRHGLSCGEDRLVILWDLAAGQELRRFEGHPHACRSVAFSPDGRFALSGGDDGEIILWRLFDTPEEITAWAQDNRYVRDLTCTERETYGVTPLCDAAGTFPTRTPYPTLTPSLVPSLTPTLDVTRVTLTPTWTPLPSNTPQTATAIPTATPVPKGTITLGETVRGAFGARPGQPSSDVWLLEGTASQTIRISNNSLDALITVLSPSGVQIAESTTTIGPLTLPETGTYTLLVQMGSMGVGGVYTFTISASTD